jgi:hypothetical protein
VSKVNEAERKAEGKKTLADFENMTGMAKLRALSSTSLERPLSDNEFKEMRNLGGRYLTPSGRRPPREHPRRASARARGTVVNQRREYAGVDGMERAVRELCEEYDVVTKEMIMERAGATPAEFEERMSTLKRAGTVYCPKYNQHKVARVAYPHPYKR